MVTVTDSDTHVGIRRNILRFLAAAPWSYHHPGQGFPPQWWENEARDANLHTPRVRSLLNDETDTTV
jgi:hypothetical protein